MIVHCILARIQQAALTPLQHVHPLHTQYLRTYTDIEAVVILSLVGDIPHRVFRWGGERFGVAGFMLLRGGCGYTKREGESPISPLDTFLIYFPLFKLCYNHPYFFHPVTLPATRTPVIITRAFRIQPPPILPFVVLPNFRNGSSELPKRDSSTYGVHIFQEDF